MALSKELIRIYKLKESDYYNLVTNNSTTINGTSLTYNSLNLYLLNEKKVFLPQPKLYTHTITLTTDGGPKIIFTFLSYRSTAITIDDIRSNSYFFPRIGKRSDNNNSVLISRLF